MYRARQLLWHEYNWPPIDTNARRANTACDEDNFAIANCDAYSFGITNYEKYSFTIANCDEHSFANTSADRFPRCLCGLEDGFQSKCGDERYLTWSGCPFHERRLGGGIL
ncbi:MAG TPA: hypothetical protein VGT44_06055 [Ktedonobacteraceae bacterium]|nr:hypothetical protein [Ktedonobacteraceae bacterium]